MSLERIFAEVFAIPETTGNETLALRQISSLDSMSHMVLITKVEEAFPIEFTEDEIADFRSIKDVKDALERHGVIGGNSRHQGIHAGCENPNAFL